MAPKEREELESGGEVGGRRGEGEILGVSLTALLGILSVPILLTIWCCMSINP